MMDMVHVVVMVMPAVTTVPVVPAIVMVPMPNRGFLDRRCGCDGRRYYSGICGERSEQRDCHQDTGQDENETTHWATPR
jgi:hypothetical protein